MKRQRNNRLIALMLTMILLFSSVAGNAFALDLADAAMSEQTNTPTQEPISQDASLSGSSAEETAEPQIIEEDVSKRGKFEKHYLCSDGSYMAVVYPEQVNYYDGGEWKEVDSTLTLSMSGDRYASSNADVSAQFAKNSASEDLVSLTDGEYSISWRVDFSGSSNKLTAFDAPVSSVASVKNPAASTRSISEENITSLDKFSSQLSYRNVYNNKVDLRYSVYYGRVEEDIILNSADALTSYKLTVNTGGLTAVKNSDNSISFNDGEGNTIFTIAAPWMKDAASEVSDNIEVALVQKGDTAYIIYAPDSEWLTADERIFPVLIDPSVTTRKYTSNYTDTYVYTGDSASTTRKNETTMKLGYQNGKEYVSYLKINNIPSLPVNMINYNSVKLKFYSVDTNVMLIDLHVPMTAWNANTLTYSTQPSSSTVLESLLGGSDGTRREYICDITSHVNNVNNLNYDPAYSGGYWSENNHGFKITGVFTSKYTELYSSENTAMAFLPILTLNYTYTIQECIENNAVYSFKNVNSGKYLTANNNVYQSTENNSTSQAFRLVKSSYTGGFFIKTMTDTLSDTVLFNYAGSINSTGYVPMNAYLGLAMPENMDGQEWLIYFVNNEYVKILSASDPNLALTAYGTSNGSNSGSSATSVGNVYVTEYTGSASQHWYVESGGQMLGEFYTNIKNHTTLEMPFSYSYEDFCYPVQNFGDTVTWLSTNTNVATATNGHVEFEGVGETTIFTTIRSTDGTTQTETCKLYITLEDGVYMLKNVEFDTKYIDLDNDTPQDNDNIGEMQTWDGLPNQKWVFEYIGNGYYKITSLRSGKALTRPSNLGNKLIQSTYTGLDTQKWFVRTVGGYYKISPLVNITDETGYIQAAAGNNARIRLAQSDYSDEWYIIPTTEETILDVKIYYDESLVYTTSQIQTIFELATDPFEEEFGIMFNLISIGKSDALNLSSQCTASDNDGDLVDDAVCGASCGDMASCRTVHHRSGSRILDDNPSYSNTFYSIYFVGYGLCSYSLNEDTNVYEHVSVLGVGNTPGINSIVRYKSYEKDIDTMQHELTHNLGGRHCDEDTPSEKCVLKAGPNDTSQWCSICSAAIMNN